MFANCATSPPKCWGITASRIGRRRWQPSSFAARLPNRFGISALFDMYAERIEAFRRHPPPPDWNGVYEAESK
jgi:hypothetical protein